MSDSDSITFDKISTDSSEKGKRSCKCTIS